MKIKPLPGQALIEVLPADKRSAGGIEFPEHTLSPEEHQEAAHHPTMPPPITGIVREIGPWPKLKNGMAVMPEFGKGAKVIIGHNAGLQLERGVGQRLRMVHQREVLAVLT
jgi:co-chaperonin GroES (HSP10)